MVTKLQWQHCRYTTIVLRISGYGAAEVFIDSVEELKHTEATVVFNSPKAVLRHAHIRDQKPSLRVICPGDPHQRNPNAPKFEDRSQEETERQERDAREAAWKMARCILNLKEKHKTTFLSPSENRCLP